MTIASSLSRKKLNISENRELPYSWINRISKVKIAILPKATYRFSAITIKIPTQFLKIWKKQFSNSFGKTKTNKQTKKKPKKQNSENNKMTSGRITIPYLKLYYREIVIKTAWYWYRNR